MAEFLLVDSSDDFVQLVATRSSFGNMKKNEEKVGKEPRVRERERRAREAWEELINFDQFETNFAGKNKDNRGTSLLCFFFTPIVLCFVLLFCLFCFVLFFMSN